MMACTISVGLRQNALRCHRSPAEFRRRLVDDYFDQYFTFHPTAGTSAGFHQYDTMLEDFRSKSRRSGDRTG